MKGILKKPENIILNIAQELREKQWFWLKLAGTNEIAQSDKETARTVARALEKAIQALKSFRL